MSLLFREGEFRVAQIGAFREGRETAVLSAMGRPPGTGPDVEVSERDERATTALEQAVAGAGLSAGADGAAADGQAAATRARRAAGLRVCSWTASSSTESSPVRRAVRSKGTEPSWGGCSAAAGARWVCGTVPASWGAVPARAVVLGDLPGADRRDRGELAGHGGLLGPAGGLPLPPPSFRRSDQAACSPEAEEEPFPTGSRRTQTAPCPPRSPWGLLLPEARGGPERPRPAPAATGPCPVEGSGRGRGLPERRAGPGAECGPGEGERPSPGAPRGGRATRSRETVRAYPALERCPLRSTGRLPPAPQRPRGGGWPGAARTGRPQR